MTASGDRLSSEMPKISVLSATYNVADSIEVLIDSLNAQTSSDFEWIVADGGSVDGTIELIKERANFPVSVINGPDFGIYDALNKAVKLARGDFYVVAGADDSFSFDAIDQYIKLIYSTEADIVTATVSSNGVMLLPQRGLPWLRGQNAYISNHSVGVAIRRSLHERFGFYSKKFPIAADQLFIKTVCSNKDVNIISGNFTAGEFSGLGVSSVDIAGLLTESFRVQLLTEKFRFIQFFLLLYRVINNFHKL
ncbi:MULTISPECIES: glycosyltransferase [unclassified Acidovorax]|uniref:glycosyltransferase n=1 Tax=unclassified Acidovorax TaxID=2684926 RepID=UPI000B3FE70D|nr:MULTISPECIES: glycosyltransferase [unclassified Acidovorax]